MQIPVTWESCWTLDFDPVVWGWDLGFCRFNEPPRDVNELYFELLDYRDYNLNAQVLPSSSRTMPEITVPTTTTMSSNTPFQGLAKSSPLVQSLPWAKKVKHKFFYIMTITYWLSLSVIVVLFLPPFHEHLLDSGTAQNASQTFVLFSGQH